MVSASSEPQEASNQYNFFSALIQHFEQQLSSKPLNDQNPAADIAEMQEQLNISHLKVRQLESELAQRTKDYEERLRKMQEAGSASPFVFYCTFPVRALAARGM